MKPLWVGAVVLAALAVLTADAPADVCQPCAQTPADPTMHGRSLKSYWNVAKGDPLVLAKAFEQGQLAACGAPDNWEWNMFTGMVAAELGKSLFNARPSSDAQADSFRTAAKRKFELAGCYFAEASKCATDSKDKEKAENNREHYWVEQYNEAINFFGQEALDPALERLDLAILIDPTRCKAYGLRGPTLIKLQRYEEAITALEKGRSLCPDDTTVAANLFAALHNRGNEIFNEAVKADNDSTRRRLYSEALDWYRKAAEIEPDQLVNLYQIGITHTQLVDLGDATQVEGARQNLKAFVDKSENKEDKAKALYELSLIEIEAKDWDKAEDYAEEYLSLAPRDAEAYLLKSEVAREKKDADTSTGFLVFYHAMKKGKAVEDVEKWLQTSGGDLGKLKEKGKPDELKLYKDESGKSMVAVFYWSKGEGYAFYEGSKLASVTFPVPSP